MKLAACLFIGLGLAACSSSGGGVAGPPGGTGGSSSGTGGSAGSGPIIEAGADANTCPGGCDGGTCINGTCCTAKSACGNQCCSSGQVCSFQKCETPGAECFDSSGCPAGDYCEYSLGQPASTPDGGTCQGGAQVQTGRCLPKPPECPNGQAPQPNQPITCLEACQYKPPASAFSPVLKYSWSGGDIMMAPIVIELDDDNCDGVVDERDIPEIVFTTFAGGDYNHNGTLHAISVVGGKVVDKWSFPPGTDPIDPADSIAGGNIDGVPGNEVVACTDTSKVRAFNGDGTPLWTSAAVGCFMPSIGDLDGDGKPEVVVASSVLNGKDGSVKATLTPANASPIVLSDMDGDGKLDIVTATRIYKSDGTELADACQASGAQPDNCTSQSRAYPAIGDFDKDGVPEVASIDWTTHTLSVWHYDASQPGHVKVLRTGIDINGTAPNNCASNSAGYTHGGGPPTIADFNGDGTPDVAVAGGIGYAVIDGTKILDPSVPANQTNLWLAQTHDCSSAETGSSVFDFNGDGTAEVVYSDEQYLRVYNGPDGTELFKTCNTTGTLTEFPLVADVDNDGHADLIVVSNSYSSITCPDDGSKQSGLRIFGDTQGNWVRTRPIWNEHAYHVTNVNEDGSIPAHELPNWKQPDLNNFRQNVQPEGEFDAPDLVVSMFPLCDSTKPYTLVARVRNIGTAAVPPGVVVGFYDKDPAQGGTKLGQGATTLTLYPAEAEDVTLPLASPPPGVANGTDLVYAVVDDGSPPHAWHECRTDNDTSAGASGACSSVH
jgi:FG-GAP-like repeat